MRKVVANLFYSIDGIVESPEKWSSYDDDMGEKISDVISRQDDVLLGGATYEMWAQYWPSSTDEPFASFINNVPKHVASSRRQELSWKNSRLLGSDVIGAVRSLTDGDGRDIGTHGSVRLVQSLLGAGLVNELILYVMPAVANRGRRLFEPGVDPGRLNLTDSRVTRSGIAILTYGVAKS